jgi:hypothetical protein
MSETRDSSGGTGRELTLLNARLANLEERVEELGARMQNLVDKMTQLTHTVRNLESAAPAQTEAQPGLGSGMSPAMAQVLQLIYQGQGELAQQELYALPEEELSAQPAVVMLAAAALFTQRGEYARALTALGRARELTNDTRLLRVIQLLETQLA